jgi:uncharacterized membrane protein YuzA (DUF378 family)
VESVQGQLPADALAAHAHVPGALTPPPLQEYKGGVHWAAFALMFAVAAVTLLRFSLQSTALANVLGITHLSLVAMAVIAAVKQHGASISRVARIVIGVALTWAAASYVTEQVIVAATIQDALRNPMRFDYWRDPVRDVAVANAVAYLALGFVGVFALLSQDSVPVER